jgi:cytochrome c oxidase subunit 2
MELHRFERLWLGAAVLLIVAFIGTIAYGAAGAGVAMVEDDGGQVDPQAVQDGNYEAIDGFRAPGVYEADDGGYDVYVVAGQFFFNPGTGSPITLPKGAEVTFHVTSADVVHGFSIVGTNVNTMVIPGQVAEFTVNFDETTEYGLICHEYCGSAHHNMAGTIDVVPPSQFSLNGDVNADDTGGAGADEAGDAGDGQHGGS